METSQSTTPQLSSSSTDLVDSAALVADISTKVKVSYFKCYSALHSVATQRINHLLMMKIPMAYHDTVC